MLVTKDRIKNTEEEQLLGKLSLIDLAGSERAADCIGNDKDR
jgi:hypothetical protein